MLILFLIYGFFLVFPRQDAQEPRVVLGSILDARSKMGIRDGIVSIEGSTGVAEMTLDGKFKIELLRPGDHILNIACPDYLTKRIPIQSGNDTVDLGSVYLERDITLERADNLISLTDAELLNDEFSSNSAGLLQATRDIFLNRAAFDFGQAFFRVRGYDSQYGKVLLNGIPMNKFHDGRPQWNNWGGLNDATRNQQFTHGLQPSEYNFGGILGTTNIDTRPSGLRPGLRLSTSASNRTYGGRLMVTYTSPLKNSGLAYSVSASRRWARQGYINGTLYDAFSVFGALEYRFNEKSSINLTGVLASNRRGRSSALTQEVFDLLGNKYNPYWGEQEGKIRNSRERKIAEPVFMLNHYYTSHKFNLDSGISYQFGTHIRSRLGYFNAPNPDPTYYRYLPSFYVNSSIGANFLSANTARKGFLERPQLHWQNLYTANNSSVQNGKAAYVLYDDAVDDTTFNVNSIANWKVNPRFQIDFGLTYQRLNSKNYARINDLLGADFHSDVDPFSNTLNDMNGPLNKIEGAIFNYRYEIKASRYNAFAQFRFTRNRWDAFLSGNYSMINYQRNGLFLNERFPENSLGRSNSIGFSNYGVKAGTTYKISGRHLLVLNGTSLNKPPVLQNILINPRENNEVVPDIQSERITSVDINYFLRLPKLTGRLSGFYTRFQDLTDVNFFFVDAGIGSDFVQEVLTDLDKLHKGFELGLEYQVSSSVQLSAVAAIGKYLYASNPSVSINFDTAGAVEDVLNPEGNVDLGFANIKDYRLAQGPQQAYALGINYRDPKYWWVGATTNYLANNYANISTITRTSSFYLDPETGHPFPDANQEHVSKLLAQNPLDDFYLLNLVGGKSWLNKGKYISVFASVNNVFDAVFRTGGYEQSRNGNFGQLQQDNLSGTPSFAPKYWFGYGRTYFLNVAYSF